jgi:aldehyde:ferredoxin oxidoreductase
MAMPPEMLSQMVADSLGTKLGPEQAVQVGERIWNLERLYNQRAGLGRKDDALPPRMMQEPLSEGMSAGHVVPLEPMLAEYYQLRGWDGEGRPTREKLAALRV